MLLTLRSLLGFDFDFILSIKKRKKSGMVSWI